MSTLRIPWAPRIILTGRVFRLPVQSSGSDVELDVGAFEYVSDRWVERDSARYFYVRSPETPGDYELVARFGDQRVSATVQVRSLNDLRSPFVFNGADWPRRWPLGKTPSSVRTKQTMQDMPVGRVDNEQVAWWCGQSDEVIYKQLPPAEIPRAHFVNAHQGSPTVGTAVFKHGGFYPWKRNFMPCDFKSICPESGDVFPSNNLMEDDFVSGEFVDDGYGYFDKDGNIYLFAATYMRDQIRMFGTSIGVLANALRTSWDDGVARTAGLMLLRYAFEECYVAAVPQFRYGPSKGVEEPWDWGVPDWGAMDDPVAALNRIGTLRYSIDTPYIAETLALAYDTLWPFLQKDEELIARAQAQGVPVSSGEDVIQLVEEMLACLLQAILDRSAGSNLPRESQGALALLRALDRPDAQDVMDWLYDEGPDTLRVFTGNNFFPDGTPPEATGGYNSIHTNGVFGLAYQIRQFRAQQPGVYSEDRYPSLVADPRAPRIVRAPHEIVMCGKSWFQFGDGSAPGSSSQLGAIEKRGDSLLIGPDCFHAPMQKETLDYAVTFTDDPVVREIRQAVEAGKHRAIGSTVHDGVGIVVLRTGEVPERAAVGVVYGDTTGHRHRDLLDVQLFAFGRPFMTDLGYPQSWASIAPWEAHWATHNTVWGMLADDEDPRVAGRGRLVRVLNGPGVQVLELEADRWIFEGGNWAKSGVRYRRLLALVETDREGVALVDLSRIWGGVEHWRTCRGLEGEFETDLSLTPRGGTVAGEEIARGQVDRLKRADDTALAYLDDVTQGQATDAWQGFWRSRVEPEVCLDLYHVNGAGHEVMTARATAMMGTPEESNYCFRTLLWRSEAADEATGVDLIFEPRTGEATLAQVEGISGEGAASGVRLVTKGGKEVRLYWAPEGDATFNDGEKLAGVGVVVDGERVNVGDKRVEREVAGLDRDGCSVVVEGMDGIGPGDRVVINPVRGHSYRVEGVEADGNRQRLVLDVTSLHGRSEVTFVEGNRVGLRYHMMARTGHLHGTHVVREDDGRSLRIVGANNPDRQSTVVTVDGDAASLVKVGEWVQVADYIVGDAVVFEPVKKG